MPKHNTDNKGKLLPAFAGKVINLNCKVKGDLIN